MVFEVTGLTMSVKVTETMLRNPTPHHAPQHELPFAEAANQRYTHIHVNQ